jgi:hypothetical protein
MARDTKTGKVAEAMILPAFRNRNYDFEPQAHVGAKLNGRKHIVDYRVSFEEKTALVSLKWQQVGGTAEEKVPYEIICLLSACSSIANCRAFLVLGGTDSDSSLGVGGWTLRKFFVNGGLKAFLDYENQVKILTLEQFVSFVNQGKLFDLWNK